MLSGVDDVVGVSSLSGFGCTGAAINASPVLGRCKERLVFLEGSPLQVELLAM